MMKIGLLIIATNKYKQFVNPLLVSADKFFLPRHSVTYYVFTDSIGYITSMQGIKNKIRTVLIEHKPFPYPTLHRYHWFTENESIFSKCDYLFYIDADMKFVQSCGDEMLGNGITAVIHPGFKHLKREYYTYETNRRSTAYISDNEGKYYCCGGFQGGTTDGYLELAKKCSENIDIDEKNGITAIHNDESHYNRYLINNPPLKILSSEYCCPEEWYLKPDNLDEEVLNAKILALQKDHDAIRS